MNTNLAVIQVMTGMLDITKKIDKEHRFRLVLHLLNDIRTMRPLPTAVYRSFVPIAILLPKFLRL